MFLTLLGQGNMMCSGIVALGGGGRAVSKDFFSGGGGVKHKQGTKNCTKIEILSESMNK